MLERNFVLVGAPDDRGVAIVGGRVGAKEGPAALRCELKNLKWECLDEGDIKVEATQDETYQGLREKFFSLHRQNFFPILIGGGHDLSFGSLSGFLDLYPDGGIVNIDPHLDCRPVAEEGRYSSGSAYRLLLEKEKLQGERLMEFGYQMECNTEKNFAYLKEKGVHLVPWSGSIEKKFRPFAQSVSALAVSFDLDSIQKEFAPGVSAPAKVGYSAREVLDLMRTIKQFPNLKHFEIMELNPQYDPDGRTVKLAVAMIRELIS